MRDTTDHGHHRGSDPDGGLVDHARAADVGVTMLWRWASMVVTILGFGIVIGGGYAKFSDMDRQIGSLATSVTELARNYVNLTRQTDLDHQTLMNVQATLLELKHDDTTLREQLDTMRNMREAYVYSQANAQARKSRTSTQVPP